MRARHPASSFLIIDTHRVSEPSATSTIQKRLKRKTIFMMDDLSTGAAVSFDGSEEPRTATVDYDFNDILPLHDDHDAMESESVVDRGDHLDPDTNLVSLDWETTTGPPSSTLLPDCFLDFDAAEDGFVQSSLEATEVSEDEMEFDSPSLEHRFEETAKRLAASMEKSRKTRVSLTLKSPAVAHYPRRNSISTVVTSVEESSHQLLTSFRARGSPSPSEDL